MSKKISSFLIFSLLAILSLLWSPIHPYYKGSALAIDSPPNAQAAQSSDNNAPPSLASDQIIDPDFRDIPEDQINKIGAEQPSLISNSEVFTANLISLYANQDCYLRNCGKLIALSEASDATTIVNKMDDGQLAMALIPSNLQRDLLNGTGPFANRPHPKLRFIMAFYEKMLTVIVKSDSKIKSLRDLIDKKVNISDNSLAIKGLLQTIYQKGTGEIPNFNVSRIEADKQISALCSGNIDAIIILVAHPNSYMHKITRLCDIDILPMSETLVSSLASSDPAYSPGIIKGGTYLGIPQDMTTIALRETLVASEEISDKLVYDLTNSVVKRLEKMKQIDKIFADITTRSLLSSARIAPLHNGVARYISDMGKGIAGAQ